MKRNFAMRRGAAGQGGFTLIEMSIITIIIGIVLVGLLQLYRAQTTTARYISTEKKMEVVLTKMQEYYRWRDHYPLPALLNLPPESPAYGLSVVPRADSSAPCPQTVQLDDGTLVAGVAYCNNIGTRDTNADVDTDEDFVLIGAVPVRTLTNLMGDAEWFEDAGIDDFGMKLTYIVTESMTRGTALNPANVRFGAIDVRDENGRTIVMPERSAHFVLISHGENSRGAYARGGVAMGDCTAVVSGTPVTPGAGLDIGGMPPEFENCDNVDGIVISGLQARSEEAYFDDIVKVGMIDTTSLWAPVPGSLATDNFYYNTNLGAVGVGTTTPISTLDINGTLRTEGQIHSERQFCDMAGFDITNPANPGVCVNPQFLGGPGNSCPAGQAAVGIERNRLVCANIFPPGFSFTCPVGQFPTSFSNLGNVVCATP